MDDALMQSNINLKSTVTAMIGSREVKKMECELFVDQHGLNRFIIHEKEKSTEVNLNPGQ